MLEIAKEELCLDIKQESANGIASSIRKESIGLLVYWFICTIKQDTLQITILYHVGSHVSY